MRILIAEDDLTSRVMLTAVLKKWGYDPVATENGALAWAALQETDAPKLVLLDWNMPEIDGVEVTRRVRALDTCEPPYIIMLASNKGKEDIVAALEAGANDYVSKPYDQHELRARLGVGQRMLEMQSNLLEARDALAHEAMHDFLTGILNRRAILNALSREIMRARRTGTGLSIGICDIDHFKLVNDSYGHLVGDEVLCGFVCCLENALRSYDYLGRWGGEEFLVVVCDAHGGDADALYDRLRADVEGNAIRTSAGGLFVTISIGVAVWNGIETEDELLAAADAAMYEAKRSGRNRICLAEEGRGAEGRLQVVRGNEVWPTDPEVAATAA